VLWGTSFNGGHVMAVAAEDPRIAAVIAQAPFTDAISTLMQVPLRNVARLTFAGLRDQVGAWLGRPAYVMPAVGNPGELAAMTAPDAKPGMEALLPPESLWRNEFAARLMLKFAFYRPARNAPRLTMPLLVCVCDGDSTTPDTTAIKAAQRAPHGELKHYSHGHFDIYLDPQAKADQIAFLRRVVKGVADES
jgi:uncharacterized protein